MNLCYHVVVLDRPAARSPKRLCPALKAVASSNFETHYKAGVNAAGALGDALMAHSIPFSCASEYGLNNWLFVTNANYTKKTSE